VSPEFRKFDISAYKKTSFKSGADLIIAILGTLKTVCNLDVTEVYLFDHGWNGADPDGDGGADALPGMQLGDTFYSVNESDPNLDSNGYNFLHFAKQLEGVTNSKTTINLRCCYGGVFADKVAAYSHRTTTGWTGVMNCTWSVGTPDPDSIDPDLAEYTGTGDYVTAKPQPYNRLPLITSVSAYDYYQVEGRKKHPGYY
jgi:hypothetical protein